MRIEREPMGHGVLAEGEEMVYREGRESRWFVQ